MPEPGPGRPGGLWGLARRYRLGDRWAGNGVEVLLSRYAKCLYDRQSINNQHIEGLLSAYDQPPEPDLRDEE